MNEAETRAELIDHTIDDAAETLGDLPLVLSTFVDFQQYLYQVVRAKPSPPTYTTGT